MANSMVLQVTFDAEQFIYTLLRTCNLNNVPWNHPIEPVKANLNSIFLKISDALIRISTDIFSCWIPKSYPVDKESKRGHSLELFTDGN